MERKNCDMLIIVDWIYVLMLFLLLNETGGLVVGMAYMVECGTMDGRTWEYGIVCNWKSGTTGHLAH